ncbi:Sporulation-specific penicillin-binding protein [Clostridium sp. N3C]|uniref:penicillin-binding transpeptidase domain-containing protein n=1 Tax=Clostridium sp. N3C TaxID=1776758 RepID=UPI00092E189D|nr:penicillin-binding transpeptidase domain-containing protein [Clostridium sp. N3C]SCN22125.1 Sporulation-specific penicillin-binding protein [Clostridium sp. N3C]
MLSIGVKKRAVQAARVLCIILSLLIIRTVYIKIFKGSELSVITNNQYTINEPISDIKYMLLDCNNKELLDYENKFYFVIDVDSYIKNNRNTDISQLNTLIYTLRGYNEDYDLSKLQYNMTNKRLYYEVDEETYYKLKDIKGIKGTYCFVKTVVDRYKVWDYQNILTSSLDNNNNPKDENSLEGYIAKITKSNSFPYISFDKDVNGDIKDEKYVVPEKNVNIKLTTDKEMEDKIKELISNEKWKDYNQIGVVVMESSTGKIKAMVQRDSWKPNINLCSATENGFEPGSIFKTIVAEAALEKDKSLANLTLKCTESENNHGLVNMAEAYTMSCNTYFEKLASLVGFKRIYMTAYNQGFFQKVLNFSGNYEVTGDIVAPEELDLKKLFGKDYDKLKNVSYAASSLSMIGIGQSVRISPLQALAIVNTVINNGTYVKPYIVDSLVSNNSNEIQKFSTEKSKVIDEKTASIIKGHMRKVVTDQKGTGKLAYINGVDCGGKTGTNTRYTVENGEPKKFSDGWFAGFVRNNGKYYSIIVYVQDIDVENEGGGSTAAPIFKSVVEKIF